MYRFDFGIWTNIFSVEELNKKVISLTSLTVKQIIGILLDTGFVHIRL